jgi:hypothetical protein
MCALVYGPENANVPAEWIALKIGTVLNLPINHLAERISLNVVGFSKI